VSRRTSRKWPWNGDSIATHSTRTIERAKKPNCSRRLLPRFETAEAKYSFLNRLLAVGTGEIRADGPVHVIEEVL